MNDAPINLLDDDPIPHSRSSQAATVRADIEGEFAVVTAPNGMALTELAESLGYDGELSVGALIAGIRVYKKRTQEDVLELGRHLVLLKEMTKHGEFAKTLKQIGIQPRAAQKFMQGAAKISQMRQLAHLNDELKGVGDILEFVTDDNDAQDNLAEMDEYDCMPPSVVRQNLREIKSRNTNEINPEQLEINPVVLGLKGEIIALNSDIKELGSKVENHVGQNNKLQKIIDDKDELIEMLKATTNLNPDFTVETNVVRQQSALLDDRCAAALAALEEMSISLMNEDVQDADWRVRLHSIWFAAHAAYARTLLLVEMLREMAGDDLPGEVDDFKAGIFTCDEARSYLADVELNRIVLANALKKKRVDLEEAAPRKAGRPKGSKNKGDV